MYRGGVLLPKSLYSIYTAQRAQSMFSNRIIEPSRKAADKTISHD